MPALRVLLLMSVALLGACMTAPERLSLRPHVTVSGQGIGRGTPVSVSVADLRPERTGGVASGAYVIDPKVDVAATLHQATVDALGHLGYSPVTGEGPWQTNLKLEVLRIAHAVSAGTLKRVVAVEAEVRATASNPQRSYTTIYRAQQEQEVAFSPRRETVQQLTDEAVSAVLTRILADQALLGVLTTPAADGAGAPGSDSGPTTFPYR